MSAIESIHRVSCIHKIQLAMEYKKAVDAYANSVSDLFRLVGIVSKDDYNILQRAADATFERAAFARAQLRCHLEQHGC